MLLNRGRQPRLETEPNTRAQQHFQAPRGRLKVYPSGFSIIRAVLHLPEVFEVGRESALDGR